MPRQPAAEDKRTSDGNISVRSRPGVVTILLRETALPAPDFLLLACGQSLSDSALDA